MDATEMFNGLLTARDAFERSEYGSYGIPQFRESMQAVLAFPELAAQAEQTGAAALLTFAYRTFEEQAAQDQAGSRTQSAAYMAVAPAVDTLFARRPAVTTAAQLEGRLETFVRAATAAIAGLRAPPPGTPVEDQEVGIITSSGGVHVASQLGDLRWPQVSLLARQVEKLGPLVKWMGRQVGDEPWGEWCKAKLESLASALPGVIEWGAWRGAKKAINAFLGVGLIPIMGHNIITFGSSVLAPWKALRDFPTMMAQQAVLYDLRAYASERMTLSSSDPVVHVLTQAISSIDWKAVRTVFLVTPVGILVSVYAGVKAVAKFGFVEKLDVYQWARVLIDAADASLTTPTPENRLAAMTVMHLAGDGEAYVELMTCQQDKAYETLAKKFIG